MTIEYRLMLQEAVETGRAIVVASETELAKIMEQVERLERLVREMERKPDAVSTIWMPKKRPDN